MKEHENLQGFPIPQKNVSHPLTSVNNRQLSRLISQINEYKYRCIHESDSKWETPHNGIIRVVLRQRGVNGYIQNGFTPLFNSNITLKLSKSLI